MITLVADTAKWDAEVTSRFNRLRVVMGEGANAVTRDTRKLVPSTVKDSLTRPEYNRGHVGLSDAIISSTYAQIADMSVILGDVKVLDQLALYWHAIEVGSDHIIGHLVRGFIGPEGTFAPDASRGAGAGKAKDSMTLSPSDATAAGITPNQARRVARGIPPHHILEKVSSFLIDRYSQEVDLRFKEVFSGTQFKR